MSNSNVAGEVKCKYYISQKQIGFNNKTHCYSILLTFLSHPFQFFLGGPWTPKNEINKILGAEREDRFSDHFSDLYKISVRFVFRTCSSSQAFSKSPAGHSKVPAEVPEIAGCWESAVYGSRPPIASKPDSSPLERPSLDNFTSQPWSEANCPCTTSVSVYLRFVTIFLLEKTNKVLEVVVRGQVASDHGSIVSSCRPVRSGGDNPDLEAIGGREH